MALNLQPGDFVAYWPSFGPPQKLRIARVTTTLAIDDQGGKWRLSDGGRSPRPKGRIYISSIQPWSQEAEEAAARFSRRQEYRLLVEQLRVGHTGTFRVNDAVLEHLRAAVAVMVPEEGE